MPEVQLKRLGRLAATIPIEGTAPLIQHRFSEKARQMMLDRQQGTAAEREPKNPETLYDAALYRLPGDRYGHPAVAFKSAIVGGARFYKASKLTMTGLKIMLFVVGEGADSLVEIVGEPKMREDPVRVSGGVADLRFRPVFWPWRATLTVAYIPNQFTLESLVALVDAGGNVGIGEWRPEFGTFKVADEGQVKAVQL
jgi:hypothetical protein